MKKKDAQKGKGVSRDAQELFDFISRTYVSPFRSSFLFILFLPPYHSSGLPSAILTLPSQSPYPLGRRPNRRQRCRPHPAALHSRRDPRARRQRAKPGPRAQGRRAFLPAPQDSWRVRRDKEGGLGWVGLVAAGQLQRESQRDTEIRNEKSIEYFSVSDIAQLKAFACT
jgi:hypothetical protein